MKKYIPQALLIIIAVIVITFVLNYPMFEALEEEYKKSPPFCSEGYRYIDSSVIEGNPYKCFDFKLQNQKNDRMKDEIEQLENKLQMLLDAEGYVEWEKEGFMDFCNTGETRNNITLTKDPIKKEWIELGCNYEGGGINNVFLNLEDLEKWNDRCKELKEKLDK